MLDPQHPAWTDYNSYNLALPGTTMTTLWHTARFANSQTPSRALLLGLDLFMFNDCRTQIHEPQFIEFQQRLGQGPDVIGFAALNRRLTDLGLGLLSLDITRKSIRTLQRQQAYQDPESGLLDLRADGYWYKYDVSGRSTRSEFRAIEKQYLSAGWFPPPENCYALRPQHSASHLSAFMQLLELAHRQDIQLTLYVSPFHARLAEAMDLAGLWETFENLKRQWVSINAAAATAAGKPPFALWDFSGYSSITTEAVPPRGDKVTRMQWFQDSTHGRVALGNRIQDRVSGAADPEFGVQLTSQNLDAHLQLTRQHRQDYRRRYPLEVQELRKLAQSQR